MYENGEGLTIPFDTNLYNITDDITFKKIVANTVYNNINTIWKSGILAFLIDKVKKLNEVKAG